MEEVVLRKELLFPSVADIEVLSVYVNIEIVRVDVQGTRVGAACPGRSLVDPGAQLLPEVSC
ncbi:hypothetical protein GCM10010521_47830 [Streptomyces rameus]|uniref:Uncharacterized protein n=1 Tax=Streptomyces rameus TaxID=68261 RepID=A0ABP6NNT6_9ACTN